MTKKVVFSILVILSIISSLSFAADEDVPRVRIYHTRDNINSYRKLDLQILSS